MYLNIFKFVKMFSVMLSCLCRMVTMVIQFSVLIVLHSCLVLVTTAEDYKCLPLVLRKACCWINETYAARNVIVFVSILINFLAAMINIVSSVFPLPGCCLIAEYLQSMDTPNAAQRRSRFPDFALFVVSVGNETIKTKDERGSCTLSEAHG